MHSVSEVALIHREGFMRRGTAEGWQRRDNGCDAPNSPLRRFLQHGLVLLLGLMMEPITATAEVLTGRQAAVVTIAAFTASGDMPKLTTALNEGLDAGLTINEVKEVLVQMYAYAGFPRSLNAINAFEAVVKRRQNAGRKDSPGPEARTRPIDKSSLQLGGEIRSRLTGSSAVASYAVFVPVIDEFLRAHLFGDIFGRDNLNWQDREVATIAALAAMDGVTAQLASHFRVGRNVGLNEAQLKGIVVVIKEKVSATKADQAAKVLSEVLRGGSSPASAAGSPKVEEAPPVIAIRSSSQATRQAAPAAHFTGSAVVEGLFEPSDHAPAAGSLVTFEAGARTAWHTHPLGQTLIVTSGVGYVQQWGSPRQEIRLGDVVQIPPDTKHWHGASQDSGLAHIAMSQPLDGRSVQWMERVTEAQYYGK